jgi:hypothetical protein
LETGSEEDAGADNIKVPATATALADKKRPTILDLLMPLPE